MTSPTNQWLNRVVVLGRVEYMSMTLSARMTPRTGHEEGAWEPIRFYVQIHDQEDITMLVIPPAFRPMMKQWLVTNPPLVIGLSANKWCEFWVQVQMFKGHMVLRRGSEYFHHRQKTVPGDFVVFMLFGLGLKVQTVNASTSNICRIWCSKHNCVGDITDAM
ncbi:Protein TOC75, chloroplastic [Hordeum vulgare]|nr:Protein TOC75, chloroplastic [Hordeum vulgare]